MSDRGAAPYLVMALAVVFVSVGSILVRMAQAPPLAVAFQRVFLASLVILPFASGQALRTWPRWPRGSRRCW